LDFLIRNEVAECSFSHLLVLCEGALEIPGDLTDLRDISTLSKEKHITTTYILI
jgi:hypothetical protein